MLSRILNLAIFFFYLFFFNCSLFLFQNLQKTLDFWVSTLTVAQHSIPHKHISSNSFQDKCKIVSGKIH